ncbi:coiled-coil domain-containing protein 168 [Eumetopias jubatus]|uniref:coiled-coil domain-containing protein 168 n=1 Tax=Eumetopias jubatus TaxID=34886 RepID=UPI001016A7E9|nr:coiled-coil domain-containing protein 168 [Eumetopias jubatus]
MSKQFYFFKKAVQNRLEDNTFWTLWELVESWTQNDWVAIFFIIFLGIIVEIILIKICTSFTKKPALPEKGSSSAQEKEDSCLKSMQFDNCPIPSSSEERVDDFSERTITSSLTSEENEGDFEDRVSTPDEVIWSSSSESKYQVSHFSESHMISSNGTSSSLSLFRSEVKEFSPSCGGYPENEQETVQFSSKKLFSIMKTNKNKNLVFSSDFNFSRSSRITIESEDLNVAPCPPAHLFLSRDQVRLLEENVRNQTALKSKTTLESKTTYLYSRLQDSLIQNQHSVKIGISAQPQDSFPGQNAPQNQHFYEARYTSQAQQFVNNQESVNSQPDIMARYFALPQDLVRKPFSSSMQDSSQTQDMDRSQHLLNVSYSFETQDSVKGLESDKHFDKAQYSLWLKDSNKIKYLIRGQNAIFKNARFLILTLSPNSFAEEVLQIKSIKPEGQKQIASSELSQYSVYGSGPLSPILKRQKNRRKTLHSKSKLSLKVPSQKSKKTPTPRVFQMTVCHTSKPSKFGCKYNAKKEELHQRKGISDMALHLTYVSKLIPPYVKKYARKKLVKVMPGVIGCRHSLSPDAQNVSYVGSIEERGTSGSTKNKKQHGRENKGQITISPKIPPQLEQSVMINTFQLQSPCSSLIEMTWKNKESLEDLITQAKEIGIAEFRAPNSKKTSDLHIPKQEASLKEALSECWQKFVSSPEVESNRRLKTLEDLKSTENSRLPLSSGEKLPTSSPEMQKCFPDGNTQKQKEFLEIVLETSEVNLLISLGIKEHEGSEQLASVKTQDSTEDVIMKEKKPLLTLHVTGCDNLSESEGLERNTRSNIKNMQGKRIFATFQNATNTTIPEPPEREMHSGLKGKTDTSTTGVSHSVVKLEKLPDEKKTWDAKYIEKRCIFKKPQEHDREEEEQTFQEAFPELTQDFSLSLQLKQKPKYVRFEIKQSSSGSRKTQSKEQEVQPQTLPTETILGTSPCPTMDPFQIEVKQSRDRPTGRGTADPENPLPVLENPRVGEVLIETTECGVPFGGSPRKIPDDHITEEKSDLQRVLPATALGSFIIYMLPLSHFKRQQIRKKLSGAKRVLSPKSVIMKVKKPTNLLMPHIRRHGTASLRRRLRGNFKILIKEMLQDKIVADVLVNVTYPHMSILPRIRTHGRLSAENRSQTKLKQEKSEDEREEKYSDSINKGSDSGNTLEEVKLQDEVRGDKEAPPEAVLHDSWNLRLDANPEKELKAEEDIPQPITYMETLTESVYSPIMDLTHVENMKKSLTTQADLKCTADSETPLPTSETPLPTSEKSLAGDPPNRTRESGVLDYGSDTREMGYFSAATSSAELPKDLPATFPETFNCHMPILIHSKMNKNKVRFSPTEGSVKPRSVHTKTMKPSVSQVFNSTGQRKKLDSKYKAKLEKINQANGLLYEFINTLYSPMQSFCHAQLKQGELGEVRPRYVDFFDKSRAFHDGEEKVEDGEEVEQKTLLEAASQHTQYLWPVACQGKETHFDEPDSALNCLTQELSVNEQDAQHQEWFVQTALQTGHQKGPREAEELKKTSETENNVTAPMGPKIPSPKAETAPENSQGFIVNAYQKENCDLVKSDEELKQPRSINIQEQPRIHGTQAVLGSASCPMLDQFQFGKLESYARFSPPKSGEAKMDGIIFSTREYGVPSDANHQKEQAGGIEKKDTVTFDLCIPALSTFKRKRHLKKYSDEKTLVNLKCGILKAKKPSVSYILSIKGGASPNHRKELGYNSTTKLEEMDQGEKMAEREKGMLGERSLSSKQVKQALSPHEENITSDDTKENSLQDAEEERSEQETLKVIPQHSQHFKFCSGQREELDLHQSENQGRGNILFVFEQDISQQMPHTDSTQGEKPKKSYQTQNGAIYTASSKLPLLKPKKSLTGQVLMGTMKGASSEFEGWRNAAQIPKSRNGKVQMASILKTINITKSDALSQGKEQDFILENMGKETSQRKAAFDYFSTDETECSTISDGSPARKLDVHIAVSLQPEEEEEDIKTPKVMKHRVDQNILPTKSGNSVLVDPGDKSSRRKMGAKKPRVLQRDLLTMSTISVLFDSESQEKILKFSGRKNLRRPKYVTTKAKKKALYSQMLNITEHDNLYCRKEQNYNLKSTINDMQQNKSIANALLSPTPVSTDNKIDTEMHSTSEAEMDQPRVTLYSRTSAELGKSPCDREVWKANSVDPQNRSSNTMKMNVQHESKEENIKKMLSESVPHYNHRFSFSAHHMKNFGSYQSESELSNLEVRSTWNLSCAAQRMRQEKCFRETILEPVSRQVMNFLQVETEKKSLHTQERIKCMGGLKTPFPKARKSETGSIQCGVLWGGNPRRKWDSYIFEKKAWNQNDLVRVLKSSGSSSLDSCEPKSQSYTLEFVGKKSIINPKHVTLKAKKRSVSQLLNITGCITGSHRKMKGCKFQYKMKTQWFEGVGEASLLAAEGTKIPPPKLVTDEHSLDATARGMLYNRTLHRNLHGHITEEKAESWENSATTFLEPIDFFTPIFSDSESQINTVRLLEEKITLNPRCLTLKEKEPAISQILKIRGRFTTKRRKKLGSNLKTKMQQMSQGKNVADTFPNTIYFTPDTCDIERQSRFKIGMDRISRFSHVQPTQMQLPVEGPVISQPVNITGHAALSINEQQGKKIDRRREKTVLNVDLKFVYDSMPILSHLKMEPSPSTWDIYEESSGKRNALNKANASSAYAYIPMYPKIIKHKAKAKTADVKNTMHIRRMKLKAKKPPVSQLFNTTGCGTRRNKKELRCDIKKQKEFQQDKTIADLFLNTVCDSGSLSSQSKQFTEVEREKSRPRKPINVPPQLELEKSLNKRKMSSSESTDIKSAISRNIKTLKQRIREQKEKRQIVSRDILPQCRDQLVTGQHAKKELDHVKIGVALKREVYPGLASQKREINYTTFNIPRIRTHAECEFPVAPRVKHKDADVIKCSVSIPWGRGVSKKNNISLNSKEQNIVLTELGASQQKTHKEQEFQKQGSISLTIRGSFAYPIMEPPRLKNTGRVAEEDIYTNKRNISHLLRREDIKETDISQGSKGQKFLCTNLVGQQTMSAAQKGEVKPAGVPESIVDSVSRPNKERLQVSQAVNTKKEDVSPSLSLCVNPGRKEQSKLTDIPLRLNGQKVTSEKLGAKQLRSSNQNKENILESISSCMLDQLYNEKLKKKVSAKGVSSKVLSSVVDKALNEAATPVDQPSLSLHNRRKEHQKESTCKVLPKSVSHSSMDVLQIKLPCVKKTLKTPTYHTANTEGIGLLVEGKEEEHPECIHYISPKSASHSLRDVLQSKIPCEKKASEEVANTVDYIPSREKISSLITGKESKVHTGKGQSGMKLTSLCTSFPSLSHTNVNSRIKVGQDKSGIPRSCLPPLKLQVSPNVRKPSFAESINRGSLSNVRESKHLAQGKKEDGLYVKDLRGLKCVTFKGRKTPFEHTLHGKEPQWKNKEQEETRHKDKSDPDRVQSKRHASIPSSPHVDWDPGIKEVLMRGITRFCPPSLTLQELSDTMGICAEPADDILSSIKKAKYMPQKDGGEMALEEIRHPKRIALKAKRTPVAHELQLNIKEKEKKMQEDQDKPVGIQSKSRVSISFPPYSEVDTRIKGEEALLIKTRPSFLQTEFQESSDRGKIAYKPSIRGDTSNSVKESKEHYIIQEEEEKVKMVKVILSRKKRSPILQLDIKEQEEKTQKIKGEPNVLATNTSTCIPAPSHLHLDTRIKKADCVTEATRCSLPELSQQKSSDAVKKANKKSTDGDITSDVQETKEHTPQKEETKVEKSAKRDTMQPKDKDLKGKKALLQDIPLNLKEQVKEGPEGEEQGRVDRGGKGEQEVVLPTNWASASLTHRELNTRIGEEDRREITGSAVSRLQLRKSSDAGKVVYTKSAGDDISDDVRVVQEYEPQQGEDRRKVVNRKFRMYPKGTTSKAKVLPLPHVLFTSGGCDAQIREVQTSVKEKLRYIQERSELGQVLTRPSLPRFKLNKSIEGKEEKQVSRPFLPPSWQREASNAEKLKHTVLPLSDVSNDSKRTKYTTQREEDKANTFEKDIMHSKYMALRAKKSPLSLILKTKKLQVNIKEQGEVGQEGNKETVVLLSKIHPFLISSTHLKWNTIKNEEGEPGIIRNDAPRLELQESLPSGQIASTDSPDSHVQKGDQCPRQADRSGVQTGAMKGSVQPRGTDFKAKTSPPSHTFSVTEHGALNERKEPQWHMREKVEQGQQRTGDPDAALTKTSPSTASPSYHRSDTRTKVDKDLLAVTGFSPSQLLCSKSSGAGKIRYADSSESIRSCSVIIKAYQSMPYTEVKDRVKIKGGKDRRVPQVITSTAETSPLPHLPSRKRLHLNIKEQGKEVPEGESEPEMVLKESYASLPSPSYLKWDTRMNEEEDTRRITQSCFPPPKIQDPSSSGKKRYTKSFDGCVLKEKDRLKTDLENKMVPIPMALKAKELPLSRVLDTKKLQWKIKEQERKVQKDENDLATHQENICTSVLILPYLKFGSREGEGYMIRITKLPLLHLQSRGSPDAVKTTDAETTDGGLSNDVKKLKEHTLPKEARDREKKVDMKSMVDHNDRYLKAKKSPNLLRNNLSALRWKTEKQEGTAQEGQREPGGAMLTKTCTCRSPLLHFNTNTRVEEKRIPILTGSSFPTVGSQESSDSEDMECIEPVTSDILISPQKGKHRMPQNKERDGVEIVNLMFPKHQEKKMQESEDEPRVVVANSSSPSPSLPHLQLDKETQVGDEMLGPARSVVQRESNAGEVVHTEAIRGDVTEDSQNKKRLVPQEEEQDREKTRDRRNMTHTTDISLKSRKSPPSLKLHRTELHLNRGGQEQKKHECPGKPPGTVLRKIYVSQPPAELTLDKGIQVDEERLGIKRPSLIPQMLSAVSDTKMRADTGAICDIRESKQHISQKGKKHEVKTVDMRIMMHHKEARISSISHIFNTKEFVLNIKELKENAYNGKDELPVVLTRTFLSVPSAPSLYLDSGSKADKDVPGLTGSFPPQQNLQESSDTQKTANTEVVAGDGEIVKKAGHSVPQEDAVQQWTSNFMISVRRRNEPPRVKSEGDLSQLVLNSQHENIYLTGFGTITGKRLEYFFTGQEVQPEKYKTETFTTFLSYPTMEPTKIENLKKQTEIVDNLNHKISPNVLVTPPRKITEEIYITFGTPISAKGFSVAEQDAHQQKTLSKALPGSADSYKFDKREKDVHNNDKVRKMLSPKVLAPQTEGSLEKMNIAESDTSPIIEEQETVVKKQVVLQSESGHKTWLDSSFSLKFPLQNGRQKMPLETDVHKQMALYPRILILPGIHMDITVFDTIGGGKEQGLPVPQQEEYILESLQKSLSSHWTFPLQSGDLEGKNKMDTSATISLEQKTVEMEEGELKIDTNVAIRLAADKTEMHKRTMVSLEGSKKTDTSSTVNLNTPSLKAQIPQINTQLITHRANSCPIKQKYKKELEVSGAKQNIQPQKLFQKHVLDSFYADIPLSLKFKSWKGRLTVADLKRELSPKDLTMKIPNHPVSQILNNTGRGTPSNRKKLEYDLKKPKKTVLRSEDASGIFVRSLSISTMSSSQMQEIVDSETNRGREKILCPSEIQQKSPHTQRNSLSTVKEGDQSFTDTAPQDSQPSVVEEQQMQKLPSANSEANLGSETKEKNVIPQTKEERVVPGHDSSGIIKEPDLRMTEEEEKAPKPILTPTEGPLMSDEPEDNCISPPQQGDQSEPIQATTAQNVQQQKTFPGTGPIPSQVKSNEIKVVADSTSAESLLPLFEAIKSIFESQIKNMIYDNICENILEKLKAPKPDDGKLPPCAGSPDTTCTVPPKVQPKPILERFTPKENNKLTNHFESKAFEIKLNLIPEMAKQSFQKLNFYLKQSFSEDNSWRLYPRHKKMCFLSLEGTDTVELHLKQKCAKDSPPVSCTKTLIVSVSSDSEEIITKLRSISKLGSGVSSVTPAKQMPLPHILQNYSVEEKDKLLIHFSMKTLEIQMKAFPRIVRESYAMASPQNIRKPLSKCIHSGFKVPKRKNRILLRFEEKSLHQIDLDLQYKYLHFLLGLPVGSVFPKPTALPKHILKLNTVAICENIDNRGESGGGFCVDTELLEQHISFKNQSPHENSSLRKFLEPTLVCASDPNQQGPVQKDTTALSELKSHMTLEKDKQCHVWFQETDMCKSFDSKTQESTPSLVDSHSTQISEDFTESQTNIESSANLEECSALEAHESEECMFLEVNPYLSQESQNILFELQKGIPLENLYKMKKSKTNLKPLYREDSGSQHIRGCRKHSSIVTPSYESHKSRKYRSSSKMPSPDWLRHGSLNAVEVLSRSSSIPFSEEKSSWTARCRTNHSLAPLTESNIKLHLAKGQGKPHRHLESNEGKKAKSDLFRKNNIHWDCDYSYTWTKEKCTRKKKVRNCESERSNYFASKPKLPSKLHQEDINFHSERKQNQPFFYACIPADSLEIMPQTIRWTVPPRTLRKTNFRVPLVAKISSSFNIWTSSKKFLESLLESFSPVHPN